MGYVPCLTNTAEGVYASGPLSRRHDTPVNDHAFEHQRRCVVAVRRLSAKFAAICTGYAGSVCSSSRTLSISGRSLGSWRIQLRISPRHPE